MPATKISNWTNENRAVDNRYGISFTATLGSGWTQPCLCGPLTFAIACLEPHALASSLRRRPRPLSIGAFVLDGLGLSSASVASLSQCPLFAVLHVHVLDALLISEAMTCNGTIFSERTGFVSAPLLILHPFSAHIRGIAEVVFNIDPYVTTEVTAERSTFPMIRWFLPENRPVLLTLMKKKRRHPKTSGRITCQDCASNLR